MNPFLSNPRTVLVTSLAFGLALMAWLPALPVQAADHASKKPASSVPAQDAGKVAAGVAKDTLKACLSRIPKDISIDQRMTAETSCHREEMDRKETPVVPETEYVSQ